MKTIARLLSLIFLLSPIAVHAQGQIGSGHVLGNPAAVQRTPTDTSIPSLFDRALCATTGAFPFRASGGWQCSTSGTANQIRSSNPIGFDNTGVYTDRSAYLTIFRDLGASAPAGIIPTQWSETYCRGNNTTAIGCSGGVDFVGDRAGVVAGTKGTLYGRQITIAPLISRNNSPFDDATGLVIQNNSTTAAATDAIYIGDSGSSGFQWQTGILINTKAVSAYRATNAYTHGLDFVVGGPATFTGNALNLNNFTVDGNGLTQVSNVIITKSALGAFVIARRDNNALAWYQYSAAGNYALNGAVSTQDRLIITDSTQTKGHILQSNGTAYVDAANQIVLTAPLTVFIDNTNGNDANDCLASGVGHACKTCSRILSLLTGNYNFGGQTVTISNPINTDIPLGCIINAAWTGAGTLVIDGGGGTSRLMGDTNNGGGPGASLWVQVAFSPATIKVQNLIFFGGASAACLYNAGNGQVLLGSGLAFSTCFWHMATDAPGASIYSAPGVASYTISGAANRHVTSLATGSYVRIQSLTINCGNSAFAFSDAFVYARYASAINMPALTFNQCGNFTGTRFITQLNGIVDSNNAGLTYFPGNIAGVITTGGQYN